MPAKGTQESDNKAVYSEETSSLYSHIYNKGVEARVIFDDEQDYEVFQGFLRDYLTAPADPETIKKTFTVNGRVFRGVPHQPKNYFGKVELIAYCLMPNHFHLLLHQTTKAAVENFIRSLCTRYSIYFNKKYHRTGTLFGGRYKFASIKDASRLRLLTRYFHQASNYSSYPEYLGQRTTPWVNTKTVLSLQKQGRDSYQNFVEKHQLDPAEQQLLEGIIFESESDHFDRETPPAAADLASNPQPQLNIPAFAAVTGVFVLLVTLGIRNVRTASVQPTVLSATTTDAAAEPAIATETAPPKTLVVVMTDDESTSVNIRQGPATESAKIGRTNHGTAFEFVSEDSSWYEIKLPDGSSGFISQEYAIKEEASN